MRGNSIFIAFFLLGCALICAAMILIENSGYNKGRREVVDLIRSKQVACQDANLILQEYQRARDCTAYGELLNDAIYNND